jgi:GDPmannose 4,6-dehydratase
MANKRALVTGCNGMDGSHMADLLLSKGYEVHGFIRYSSNHTTQKIDHILDKITLYHGELTDPFTVMWAIKKSQPDEIYNFGALSHVGVSWEMPLSYYNVTAIGILNILESCRILGLSPRVYQASTSELFSGKEGEAPQDESTPFNPISPYASAKLYAYQIAKNYREAHGMFVCNGILFNHESSRRGESFVTKKILNAVDEVKLGNISASRDWGYAPEYMEAAWLMLQQDKPDDYVISTEETHTIEEFIKWKEELTGNKLKVIIDDKFVRPNEVHCLRGNSTKAHKLLGWSAKVKGKELVKKMLND